MGSLYAQAAIEKQNCGMNLGTQIMSVATIRQIYTQ